MTRRRSSSSEMNLESLLDTLTNVVGVLVLLLMVVSLNVREAVERILDLNPEQKEIRELATRVENELKSR